MTAAAYSGWQGERFVRLAVAIAALGGLLFGYDTGVISGALLFLRQDFHLSPTMQEFVVSSVLVGAVLGAVVGGALGDRFGQRKMIILAGILFTLTALGTAAAQSVVWLVVGRIVVGIAIGIASFISPMYMAEISPPKVRGSLVSLNQLAITIGILVAYLVDYGFSGMRGWRYMFGLAAVPSTVLVLGMWLMPASPRWLMSHQQEGRARSILQRIRGTQDVEEEVRSIQEVLAIEGGGAKELLSPLLRMALIVGIGLAIFQQITGINTVIYYAPTIFEFAGFKSAGFSILATAGVGAVNVIFTLVAIWLLDKVGRRPLLLVGLVGQMIGLAILGWAFQLHHPGGFLGYLALVSLAIYVGSFAVGLGPVFWLLISEIYPQRGRAAAMSIATLANWGFNLLVAVTFLTLVAELGRSGTFWLYAGITVAAWAFVFFLVPETKARTLEEIQEHWLHGPQTTR